MGARPSSCNPYCGKKEDKRNMRKGIFFTTRWSQLHKTFGIDFGAFTDITGCQSKSAAQTCSPVAGWASSHSCIPLVEEGAGPGVDVPVCPSGTP